jgi:uncharacterized RDD family membrane protein YckC
MYSKYGGFWIRSVAYAVDIVILFIARYPITLIFWIISDDFNLFGGLRRGHSNIGLNVLFQAINVLAWFLYFIVMDVRFQTTLGKALFKLKVMTADMAPLNYRQATLREVFKIVSEVCCLAGMIWAAFDPRKQTWHDKVAKTLVVKSP